jgi:hypothetical protein
MIKLLPDPVIQNRKILNDYKVIWEEPITIDNDTKGLHFIQFFFNDTGMILEVKEVLNGFGSTLSLTTWIRILCSTGIGWIMRDEVEPV